MLPETAIANALWAASNIPAWLRYCRALRSPQIAQRHKLRRLIARNAQTAFGKAHGFEAIRSYEDFIRRVPLANYETLEPWITRIRAGEQNILTRDRITHLIPTSGSTGARKLIPFTCGLQNDFNAAIGPWLVDLARRFPKILGGPSYWSITPVFEAPESEASTVPIGFESDTAYLGGRRQRLADAVMAVPRSVGRARCLDSFRYQTLFHLVRCRELRLISVWHPSFLTLLLDALPTIWDRLLSEMESGRAAAADPARAKELRRADPCRPETLWPNLCLISCWGDGAAAMAAADLRKRFARAHIQGKGLLATEAFMTIPFAKNFPLAVGSHFFEFLDARGNVFPVECVREGEQYEVVVSTSGGLWRYRPGDLVCVTGRMHNTPCLKFLGRAGNVSDQCGEKLSAAFVANALAEVFHENPPRFCLLAPERDEPGCRYVLYVEGIIQSHWAGSLEVALRKNPHYACCRDLEQLLPLQIFAIEKNGFETFALHCTKKGARLSEIKPAVLSSESGWSDIFTGGKYEVAGEICASAR
jgi:hypothetical protein